MSISCLTRVISASMLRWSHSSWITTGTPKCPRKVVWQNTRKQTSIVTPFRSFRNNVKTDPAKPVRMVPNTGLLANSVTVQQYGVRRVETSDSSRVRTDLSHLGRRSIPG